MLPPTPLPARARAGRAVARSAVGPQKSARPLRAGPPAARAAPPSLADAAAVVKVGVDESNAADDRLLTVLPSSGVALKGDAPAPTPAPVRAATLPAPTSSSSSSSSAVAAARATILDIVSSTTGRGKGGLSPADATAFAAAVATLETDGGVPAPKRTADPRLAGRWALLFTENAANSASPIQRSFTGIDAVSIYQEVSPAVFNAADGSLTSPCAVTNVVQTPAGTLRVRARASTAAAPIPGFTPRSGAGIPLLGKSSSTPPTHPGVRLDFAFQSAAFYWKAGVPLPPLPYPVPFSLFEAAGGPLGDEVKGWLDVTYLSPDGTFRLSRGNKGTLFVLARAPGPAEELAAARSLRLDAAGVAARAADLAASGAGVPSPATSPLAPGRWRLVWSEQAPDANPLQRALADRVDSWQVIGTDGTAENVVNLLPGGAVQVVALAACGPASGSRTAIDISRVELRLLGGLVRIPLSNRQAKPKAGPAKKGSARADVKGLKAARPTGEGFIDWLFLSPNLRVTRGSKGSLFVHVRDD
jgi:hypothetical protein